MKKALHHIEWVPRHPTGHIWSAYYKGTRRGYAYRFSDGRYSISMYGRRDYCGSSMRDCAKQLVAWLNNLKPSSL